jgi:hypothetical protein
MNVRAIIAQLQKLKAYGRPTERIKWTWRYMKNNSLKLVSKSHRKEL